MQEKLKNIIHQLYPICRSITGDGVRQTLQILQSHIPLQIHEIPTGTIAFDWTVPKEWNIRSAWLKNPQGKTIIDFKNHNLHILNYSVPIQQKMTLAELRPHLFSLPNQPDLIPYRTSYYKENWGFCLPHKQLEQLEEGEYEVHIESSLEDGFLTYGELFIPGKSEQEILLTAHICHPSLANDNLSGISILTYLSKAILAHENNYSYRILFIPGTIGSITWLSQNETKIPSIKHGLVASLLGDSGAFTYKKSRQGNTELDQTVARVLEESSYDFQIIDFFPYGYDERQFCSPAFNLAVGNLTRSQFGQFPEYHTSADNLDFVKKQYLNESFLIYQKILTRLENNFGKNSLILQSNISNQKKQGVYYKNLFPKCEPQLGKRGLYEAIGGDSDQKNRQMAMLWILNFSDGTHSLHEITQKSGIAFEVIQQIAKVLEEEQVIKKLEPIQ